MTEENGLEEEEYTKTKSHGEQTGQRGRCNRNTNGAARFTDRDISRLHPHNAIRAPPPSEADDVTMTSPDPQTTVFGENIASPEENYQRAFSSMSLLPRGWNPSHPQDGLSYQERSRHILDTLREEGIITRAGHRRLRNAGLRRGSNNTSNNQSHPYKTSATLQKTAPDDDRIQARIHQSLSMDNVHERKMAAIQDDVMRGVRESELRRERILAKMADSRQTASEKNAATRVKTVEKNRLNVREGKLQKLKRDDVRRKRMIVRRRCSLQGSAVQETTSTSPLDAILSAGSSITKQTCNR